MSNIMSADNTGDLAAMVHAETAKYGVTLDITTTYLENAQRLEGYPVELITALIQADIRFNQLKERGPRKPGGKRKNPLLRKHPAAVNLPQWLIDWLVEQHESRAVLIERALIEHYQLTPPGETT